MIIIRCWQAAQYAVDSSDTSYGWYDYDGSLLSETTYSFSPGSVTIPAESGVKFYDSTTGNIYDDYIGYCNKFVQVVTSIGKNKFWAGKVYEGSSYEVPSLKYTYEAGYAPFMALFSHLLQIILMNGTARNQILIQASSRFLSGVTSIR